MAVTPEGKVKKMVRAVLGKYADADPQVIDGMHVKALKQYWPVPAGYGASDLDCIVCYYGMYIAIETKAPGEKPTPRQRYTMAETLGAGGMFFVIDGEEGCARLDTYLMGIRECRRKQS